MFDFCLVSLLPPVPRTVLPFLSYFSLPFTARRYASAVYAVIVCLKDVGEIPSG